jgi:hypothetical protein
MKKHKLTKQLGGFRVEELLSSKGYILLGSSYSGIFLGTFVSQNGSMNDILGEQLATNVTLALESEENV